MASRRLRPSRSLPVDGVPAFIIKGCFDSLSEPLIYLFNFILETGFFPDVWKVAVISPIYKGKGSRSTVCSYRPIAILSSFLRLFELTVLEAVRPLIFSFLSDQQHGFCKGRSTTTNLLCLKRRILEVFDRRSQLDVIYFDFSKAFDVLRPDVLSNKLLAIGLSSPFVDLLAQLFSDRSFSVRILGHLSDRAPIATGVPQGSTFGPILFSLFVNDLLEVFPQDSVLMYADDVKLMHEVTQPEDCFLLQSFIDRLHAWSVINCLPVNVTKCSVMTFTNKVVPLIFDYVIDGQSLCRVSEVKDLGILFSSQLAFGSHVRLTVCKLNRLVGLIGRSFGCCSSPRLLASLWKSLIVPVFLYGITVWYPWQCSFRALLERPRRRFLRLLRSSVLNSTGLSLDLEELGRRYGIHSVGFYFKRSVLLFYLKLLRGEVCCAYLLSRVDIACLNPRFRNRILFRPHGLRLFEHLDNMRTFYDIINSSLEDVDIFFQDHSAVIAAALQNLES